jgi:hypothetical protein
LIYQFTIEAFQQLYKNHLCFYVFYQNYPGYVLVKQGIPDNEVKLLLEKHGKKIIDNKNSPLGVGGINAVK